jgi:hypothetical protein
MTFIENEPDFNWVKQYKLLHNIQKNYCKEPMENIAIYALYLNSHRGIDKIICDNIVLSSNCIISKEDVFNLIHSKKIHNGIQYRLLDMLLYNIDIEPSHIQSFSKINSDVEIANNRFIQSIPIFNEIYIAPSIFIFHSINSIYIIFHQIDKPETLRETTSLNKITYKNKMKHTKKVCFNLSTMRKTKKYIQK